MSYLGEEPKFGSFASETFSGNGSATSFTLTHGAASPSALLVTIDGVKQQTTAYSITDTALDFGSGNAPAAGTNNIEVVYLGTKSLVGTVADGAITASKLASNAVETAKIANSAVTGAKIANPLNLEDGVLQRPEVKDYAETVNAIGGTGGGTQDIDLTAGNVVTATVDTSANTFTFSNPPATGRAGSFTLILTNGGSQTVNWPSSVDWDYGTVPVLTTAGVDILTFTTVNGGTTWYGLLAGRDMQ